MVNGVGTNSFDIDDTAAELARLAAQRAAEEAARAAQEAAQQTQIEPVKPELNVEQTDKYNQGSFTVLGSGLQANEAKTTEASESKGDPRANSGPAWENEGAKLSDVDRKAFQDQLTELTSRSSTGRDPQSPSQAQGTLLAFNFKGLQSQAGDVVANAVKNKISNDVIAIKENTSTVDDKKAQIEKVLSNDQSSPVVSAAAAMLANMPFETDNDKKLFSETMTAMMNAKTEMDAKGLSPETLQTLTKAALSLDSQGLQNVIKTAAGDKLNSKQVESVAGLVSSVLKNLPPEGEARDKVTQSAVDLINGMAKGFDAERDMPKIMELGKNTFSPEQRKELTAKAIDTMRAFPEYGALLDSAEKLGLDKDKLNNILQSDDPKKAVEDLAKEAIEKIRKDPTLINDYLRTGSQLLKIEPINQALRSLVNAEMKDGSLEKKIVEKILGNPEILDKVADKLSPEFYKAVRDKLDAQKTVYGADGKPTIDDAFRLAAAAFGEKGTRDQAINLAAQTLFSQVDAKANQEGYNTWANEVRNQAGIFAGIAMRWDAGGDRRDGAIGRSQAATKGNLVDDLGRIAFPSLGNDPTFRESSKSAGLDVDALLAKAGGKFTESSAIEYFKGFAKVDPKDKTEEIIARAYFSISQPTKEQLIRTSLEQNQYYIDQDAKATDLRGDTKALLDGIMEARALVLANGGNYNPDAVKAVNAKADEVLVNKLSEVSTLLGLNPSDLKPLIASGQTPQTTQQAIGDLLDKAGTRTLPSGYTTDTAENVYKGDKALLDQAGNKFAFYRDANSNIVSVSKNGQWSAVFKDGKWQDLDKSVEASLRSSLAYQSQKPTEYTNPRAVDPEYIKNETTKEYQDWYNKVSVDNYVGKVTDREGNNLTAIVRKDGSSKPQVYIKGSGWKDLDYDMATRLRMPEMSSPEAFAKVRESFAEGNNQFSKPFDAKNDAAEMSRAANPAGFNQQYYYPPQGRQYINQSQSRDRGINDFNKVRRGIKGF